MILKKWKTKIVPILLAVTLAFPITLFAGCANEKISDYTVEEHIEKVSEKVEARYFADDGKYEYTDYEVYPLYDENDILKYFVVDFEPCGYVYIWVQELNGVIAHELRYFRQVEEEDSVWRRYTIVENAGDNASDDEKIWEVDENGEYIYYQDSHFKVAGIDNEKRYLVPIEQGGDRALIPAVKKNGKYLNLISMEIMEEDKLVLKSEIYPIANISFAPKPAFFGL